MNMANLITILRFPLLIIIALLLYFGGETGQLLSVPLIIILILMDSLDGMVARRRNQATLTGSALDIAADRAVEIVMWVIYAHLGLIPVIIPLTFILRGAVTDSIRNVALQHGRSAYGMMRSPLGRWLVTSPAMRSSYGIVKVAAFALLALTLGLRTGGKATWESVESVALTLSWIALAICIIRGLPVVVEAKGFFQSIDNKQA